MDPICSFKFTQTMETIYFQHNEEMMMNETLVMLQFFSCFIIGQFGEIIFAKISFDEVIAMSNTIGHLEITYLRWN